MRESQQGVIVQWDLTETRCSLATVDRYRPPEEINLPPAEVPEFYLPARCRRSQDRCAICDHPCWLARRHSEEMHLGVSRDRPANLRLMLRKCSRSEEHTSELQSL